MILGNEATAFKDGGDAFAHSFEADLCILAGPISKLQEASMSAAMIQFVFRPNPGSALPAILELAKESAALWKKHGAAEVSLWVVQVGEIGNMAFIVRSESTAKLGATIDALNADPAFQDWRMRVLKSGLSTWVRSNQAFEVAL